MQWKLMAMAVLAAGYAGSAQAVVVNQGEVVRDSYALTGSDLLPASYLLQFTGDLLDPGESFSVSLFDSGLNPFGFTQFTLGAGQVSGRAVAPLSIDRDDLAPSGIGPFDPVRIPDTGFIEFTALSGSFDLTALTLTASEVSSFPFTVTQDRLTDFSQVTPSAFPLPAPLALLFAAVLGLAGLGRIRKARHDLPA